MAFSNLDLSTADYKTDDGFAITSIYKFQYFGFPNRFKRKLILVYLYKDVDVFERTNIRNN